MKTKQIPFLRVLLFVIFLSMYSGAKAQTFYALQIDRRIRNEAIDLTAKYQPYLVMGTDQALQFQQTVARFLVKKKAIEEDDSLSEGAKYSLLKKLATKETSEMGQVLEDFRWREYMRVKPQIQPLPPKPAKARIDAIADVDLTN
ncbi:hypothetical protein [Pseudozobellia thermophila]|uniref:Uncharacterized protein n=1 Tax=Pseudozobellia thermophila TaxID=192903 RepID=A0A1M6P9S4_9FLAO|nr:hypothetical protein [Pseudozobellia thermophila]SHK04612.1 hypothetical protein SAMN04488513_1196 [Pseudozobellia thermophila]